MRHTLVKALAVPGLALTLLWGGLASQATANMVLGDYLGTFIGNDSAIQVETDLGLGLNTVQLLARVDVPATSDDGLTISNLTLNGDSEPISGDWSYTDPLTLGRLVDIFVVKAGNQYAAYRYTDLNTANMRNVGIWNTSGVQFKGLSHVTAYRVVPEPTSLFTATLGALSWMGLRRRRGQ